MNDREILDKDKPLSQCILWPMIETFYAESGPDAWAQTPYYPTSNAYIADTYAELIIAFLRDSLPILETDEPIYLLELAAGVGAFSFLALKALKEKLALFPSLSHLNLRYVMTDFTQKNLDFWEADSQLKAFMDDGILEIALFWPEKHNALTLLPSGKTLDRAVIRNPVIVISNYFFDSIRHDFFQTERGVLREARPTVWREPQPGPPLLSQLKLTDTYREISSDYYPDPRLNAILEGYRHSLPEGSILFPIGGFRALQNLLELAHNRLFFLAIDKGFHTLEYMRARYETPYIPHTGSFSFSVNFHAVGEFFKAIGGRSWHGPENPLLTTLAALSFALPCEGLNHAASRLIERICPPQSGYELSILMGQLASPEEEPSAEALYGGALAAIQFACDDPWTFQCGGEYLLANLARCDRASRAALRGVMRRVEANLSPLVFGCFSACSWLRCLYYHLGDFSDCLRINERAFALFGEHRDYYFYPAAIAEQRGERDAARAGYEKALECDPECALSREGVERFSRSAA